MGTQAELRPCPTDDPLLAPAGPGSASLEAHAASHPAVPASAGLDLADSVASRDNAAPATMPGPRLGGRMRAAVVAYGAVFMVVLPILLALWMRRLDRLLDLPRWGAPAAGLLVAAGGLALMTAGMIALWHYGDGLPMSPFPPARLVTRGAYALVPHPIYVGAVVASAGLAVASGSPSGFWIVSPVLAASTAAFVLGYERDATQGRFGAMAVPWLRLPPAADHSPSVRDRLAIYLLVFLPWLVACQAVDALGIGVGARSTYLAFEARLPVTAWTEVVYALAYPYVLIAPLVAKRQRTLRTFAVRGLAATAGIGLLYLLVPLVAPTKPVPAGTPWAPLMAWERWVNVGPAGALPAFHVVWVCLGGALYAAGRPAFRWPVAALTAAIALSAVTTGMHSVLAVTAGVAAYGVIVYARTVWAAMCRGAEAVANSWREWRVGQVRLLSHGVYAALGATTAAAVGCRLAGPGEAWWIVGTTFAGELTAGLWAQVLEGSPQLLRPFGYFGSIVGVLAAAALASLAGHDPWRLLAAIATGGCFAQAIGRLRCLVQGCCHGRPVAGPWGIIYRHPRSRVLRLAHLGGVPLHPTPLYSIVWTFGVGLVLLRLWTAGVPHAFIAGSYLILVGLGRFVEEHYRGEPQTAWVGGLPIYQWLAIGFVVAGAAFTALGGTRAVVPAAFDPAVLPGLALVATVSYVAFGVDFPASNRRFSRLAAGD